MNLNVKSLCTKKQVGMEEECITGSRDSIYKKYSSQESKTN